MGTVMARGDGIGRRRRWCRLCGSCPEEGSEWGSIPAFTMIAAGDMVLRLDASLFQRRWLLFERVLSGL